MSTIVQSNLDQAETDALNNHGNFFKKKILNELKQMQGIEIVSEEFGVTFGQTRVIDIVARDTHAPIPTFYVLECKRAWRHEKRWLFFEDHQLNFRAFRDFANTTSIGVAPGLIVNRSNRPRGMSAIDVCSEGYEFSKKTKPSNASGQAGQADQNPVFKAASQLSAGYLGFITSRSALFRHQSPPQERYIPILVTNADIALVEPDLKDVSLETGTLTKPPASSPKDFLVLQHPFPTPERMDPDPRDTFAPRPEYWPLHHKESIYVVRASALQKLLACFVPN